MGSPPPRSIITVQTRLSVAPGCSSGRYMTPRRTSRHCSTFLNDWKREIEAALQSVLVIHGRLIGPTEWRAVDGVLGIQ